MEARALNKLRLPLALAAVVLFIAGGVVYDKLQFRAADLGFRHVTGLHLPANVTAVAHRSEMNDNLFHTTHYWELRGPRDNLRELATKFGLSRSGEDAAHRLSGAASVIASGQPPRLVEGYEGNPDGGRDRWLMILEPGDRAEFTY